MSPKLGKKTGREHRPLLGTLYPNISQSWEWGRGEAGEWRGAGDGCGPAGRGMAVRREHFSPNRCPFIQWGSSCRSGVHVCRAWVYAREFTYAVTCVSNGYFLQNGVSWSFIRVDTYMPTLLFDRCMVCHMLFLPVYLNRWVYFQGSFNFALLKMIASLKRPSVHVCMIYPQ